MVLELDVEKQREEGMECNTIQINSTYFHDDTRF